MLFDNPELFSFKTQQFISFFRHSHLFQLKCPALWLHAALSSTNKTVSKSTIQVQFRFSISVQLRGNGICINDLYVSFSLSTVYRDRHLLPSALSVQEEEHEAHRHCDAAGGPARYERVEVAQLRADAVD